MIIAACAKIDTKSDAEKQAFAASMTFVLFWAVIFTVSTLLAAAFVTWLKDGIPFARMRAFAVTHENTRRRHLGYFNEGCVVCWLIINWYLCTLLIQDHSGAASILSHAHAHTCARTRIRTHTHTRTRTRTRKYVHVTNPPTPTRTPAHTLNKPQIGAIIVNAPVILAACTSAYKAHLSLRGSGCPGRA